MTAASLRYIQYKDKTGFDHDKSRREVIAE